MVNKQLIIKDAKKIASLIFGLLITAYGITQVKVLNLGMGPWDTFALGIHSKTGMEFGRITQIVGFFIVIFSMIIKIYPGIGTILNMVCVGFFVDIISKFNITLVPQNYILKIIVLIYGNIIFNYGIYTYLKFELGAGPRDGLMVGLVKITGLNIKYVRTAIESIALIVGYLLGGTVGIGTVISTFSGGYILNKIFMWKGFDPKETSQRKITDYLILNKKEVSVENNE